jgi:competence protein ComGC
MSKIKNIKSQEEMVGFVLIMVIVAIVLLIILFFIINNTKSNNIESKEISKFLRAAMSYSSNCSLISAQQFSEISDLVKGCYYSKECLDGRNVCGVLNKTLSEMLKVSWIDSDNRAKGYMLKISESQNVTKIAGREMLSISFGNKTRSIESGEELIAKDSGSLIVSFEIYM